LPGHPSHPIVIPPPGPCPCANVRDFGAKGNGFRDDQAAIDEAIAVAEIGCPCVFFPPGNYLHSTTIVAPGVALEGAGESSILTAGRRFNGAVVLTGNNASVSSLVIQYKQRFGVLQTTPDRQPSACAIWLNAANNFLVNGVIIANSANGGIDVNQSTNGMVKNCVISGTANRAMQILDCSNVSVLNNTMENFGRDGIDVYAAATGSQNLTIANNIITVNSRFGNFSQAMELSGLTNSAVQSNFLTNGSVDILGSTTVGQSGQFGPVNNLSVTSNTITGSFAIGTPAEITTEDFSNNAGISNVLISGNALTNNRGTNGVFLGGGNNITCNGNSIATANLGVFASTCANIFIDNNNISDTTDAGIYVNATRSTGAVDVSGNQLANCSQARFFTTADVLRTDIGISGNYTALTIANNNYAGPANFARFYVDCLVPSTGITRTITGNTQSTMLPNNILP
jgi:hypothetical protein